MKAADLDDVEVLVVVERVARETGRVNLGANREAVSDHFADTPEKVTLAKLRSLVKRGLLNGCACGCRGDFTVTDAGARKLRSIG